MTEAPQRNRTKSLGLFSNYRYLCRQDLMLRAMESARARKKCRKSRIVADMKRKSTDNQNGQLDANKLIKKMKLSDTERYGHSSALNCDSKSFSGSKPSDHHSSLSSDHWEVDSGFSSEASPPVSGRSSPCVVAPSVVALDCEMVGTGPGGRCSELARCSILDYQGRVLYDRYVQPRQTVTDYRTRWSGIRRHHLTNATPFTQARDEICRILEGKVVVGHSVYNDFEVLDISHPGHMVRDTITARSLRRLAGFQVGRCASLKVLAARLLNRKIQMGSQGHCSVEDARATLDLYKLVEGEWELELHNRLRGDDDPHSGPASFNHYMQDKFWPSDVMADSQ